MPPEALRKGAPGSVKAGMFPPGLLTHGKDKEVDNDALMLEIEGDPERVILEGPVGKLAKQAGRNREQVQAKAAKLTKAGKMPAR